MNCPAVHTVHTCMNRVHTLHLSFPNPRQKQAADQRSRVPCVPADDSNHLNFYPEIICHRRLVLIDLCGVCILISYGVLALIYVKQASHRGRNVKLWSKRKKKQNRCFNSRRWEWIPVCTKAVRSEESDAILLMIDLFTLEGGNKTGACMRLGFGKLPQVVYRSDCRGQCTCVSVCGADRFYMCYQENRDKALNLAGETAGDRFPDITKIWCFCKYYISFKRNI